LTIVVAGGGPTGGFWYVCRNEEEYFPKEYPELGTSASNIYLVDGEMLC
jgi:NADH dehydrogenase